MKANVTYTEEGEPCAITVEYDAYGGGELLDVDLSGSTAVITNITPPAGEEGVLGEELHRAISLLEKLPCVQAWRLEEVDE